MMRTALLWTITQRVVAIPYRRFGTTYRFHLQECHLLRSGNLAWWQDALEKLRHLNRTRGRQANRSSWNPDRQQELRWQRKELNWLALRRKVATEVPGSVQN